MKVCNKCDTTKPLDEFPVHKQCKDGRRGTCKACVRTYTRGWQRANPEKNRAAQLKYTYGLSAEDYAARLLVQGGGCALCGKTPEANGKDLAVDHEHACCPGTRSCGKCVRGLLCDPCNRGLGCFADSPDRLRAAAAYLSA
ncbi:endonuclease VII domain-containing protein [Streptomyces sp. NPDC005166]